MNLRMHSTLSVLLVLVLVPGAGAEPGEPLQRVGTMRDALAKGEDHPRVVLEDIAGEQHFFGVGALAGLEGEITVFDSTVYATSVTSGDSLRTRDESGLSATLLFGSSVGRWSQHPVSEADGLDGAVRDAVIGRRFDPTDPLLFLVDGTLTDVRLHIIRGACPIHAAGAGIELAADELPWVREFGQLEGTVVGIHAADSDGVFTHPGTDVHAHVLFIDEETGLPVTAHLERATVAAGAIVKLPDD